MTQKEHKFNVGDLVYLKYDRQKQIPGIILSLNDPFQQQPCYTIYWTKPGDRGSSIGKQIDEYLVPGI